jgi:hypothetical protein
MLDFIALLPRQQSHFIPRTVYCGVHCLSESVERAKTKAQVPDTYSCAPMPNHRQQLGYTRLVHVYQLLPLDGVDAAQ